MSRHRRILFAVLWILLASCISLPAQIPEEAGRIAGEEAGKIGKDKAGKELDEETVKKLLKGDEFYQKYSTVDREYYGWFSSAELKKPFNSLVDDAIISIRQTNSAALFKAPANSQVVDALQKQNQALAPPEQMKLDLETGWIFSDTLKVSKGSDSATVRMSTLKDYISEAIGKVDFPPFGPSHIKGLIVVPNKPGHPVQVK
jgi:hypothetical protein